VSEWSCFLHPLQNVARGKVNGLLPPVQNSVQMSFKKSQTMKHLANYVEKVSF
jgi:hypothetical protein